MTRLAHTLPDLTPKQRDVLALVADNRTSKEIAARLGISESAVNQRIEMVRSRLGGLPRGELARLYRQEFALSDPEESLSDDTWQKIHLPESLSPGKEAAAESISPAGSALVAQTEAELGDGSQLSAFLFTQDEGWLSQGNGAGALVHRVAIAAIILTALLIAFSVTELLGPVGG